MIRYREFAISTASLAGLSLAGGCDPSNVNGEWGGQSYILSNGTTYDLPFSFDGTLSGPGFFGSYSIDFDEWTMDFTLTADKNGATLVREQVKVYTYTYDYGSGYDPYVATVDWQFERTYTGTATHVGDRQFNIVLGLDDEEETLIVNGEEIIEEDKESPTSLSAVLDCETDGKELHCRQGTALLVLAKE